MLAVRTPIAGIFIAVLVLVGEVAVMKAFVAAREPEAASRVRRVDGLSSDYSSSPPPNFGRKRGCADRVRISGPDDLHGM
jgi:hypothetical protein